MDSRLPILLFCVIVVSFFTSGFASSLVDFSVCNYEFELFRFDIEAKCPRSLYPRPPIEVDGDSLDRLMSVNHGSAYTSVLFYASWCPFSRALLPKFDMLSSMIPQIQHLAVEHSQALPSVFSRYGIHMVDVRRFWLKLSLVKTRNFHQRAKNAQAWASSLASVSLG